ncbi:phosphatidylinositol-specific phospholipase C [Chitinimonas sp.]|uniref:phosphatidylinositol-specific phospholipase C n=1 Tax=Chitinimonas sp. TaxID=1934313 RepID=UPI0035B1458E
MLRRLLPAALLALALPALAHQSGAYLHDDRADIDHSTWMSVIDGNTPLRDLSLAGTHDSLSYYGGDIVQTQSLSLANQLRSGIRVFDVRCRHINNVFAIHHGLVFQKTMFGDVLNGMADFLRRNPSETILMSVQEEYTPEGNSRSFEATLADYKARYGSLLWEPSSQTPTLGETRGKIVLIQNFTAQRRYGLDPAQFHGQGDWILNTNWDLYAKWEKVKAQLGLASANFGRGYYTNGLSASTGSFPYFVASGHSSPQTGAPRLLTGLTTPGWRNSYPDFPRVGCFWGICSIAFEGTNDLTHQYIVNNRPRYVGWITMDFPGNSLVDTLVQLNYPRCSSWVNGGGARYGEVFQQGGQYYRALSAGRYGPLPAAGSSNAQWQYLGNAPRCQVF